MVKTAAVVIVFHPDRNVVTNILSYSNKVEKLYIIDNSSTFNQNIKDKASFNLNTVFIYDGSNEGIAKRLNHVCNLAIQDGFEFLLTMDQDSYFEERDITNYLNCIESLERKFNVSMFGVNYQKRITDTNCNFKKVKFIITSGSILNLNAYKVTGGFDEKLFIDFVDTDYCFKSILKGFELIEFSNIFLHHQIGETSTQRSLKSLRKTNRSIHSSVRLYYMVRNFFYINKKYKTDFKEELAVHKKDLQNRIKNKLLYNANRMQTIKFLFKAWKDFKQNKMGKLPD